MPFAVCERCCLIGTARFQRTMSAACISDCVTLENDLWNLCALKPVQTVQPVKNPIITIDCVPLTLSDAHTQEFLSTARYPRPTPPLPDSAPLSSSPDSHASGSSLFGLDQVDWQHRSAVKALADHVLYGETQGPRCAACRGREEWGGGVGAGTVWWLLRAV